MFSTYQATPTLKKFAELQRLWDIPCLHILAHQPEWRSLIDQVMATRPNLEEEHNGLTPLERAIVSGSLDLARALVAAGANPSPKDPHREETLIHLALKSYTHSCPRYKLVKYALELCPDKVNSCVDEHKVTPLHLALAAAPRSDIVQLLLQHGADPNIPNIYKDGRSVSILRTISDSRTSMVADRDKIFRLVIAYGGRFDEEDQHALRKPLGDRIIAAVEQCRSVAWVVLGLRHVGGRVMGNGRDALRLVAKEVWLSRMDEGWEVR